ncbi:hypothetical protein [Dongshaea marina]|uniref:hypothetical protein n=1 Tax=Dongshaea marina TaxID=2047966 RepID=UPI000D3ED935|nr:hypothetical protein [Dongshaea marina]
MADWKDGAKSLTSANVDKGAFHGNYAINCQNKVSLTLGSAVDLTVGFKSYSLLGGSVTFGAGVTTAVNANLNFKLSFDKDVNLRNYVTRLKAKDDKVALEDFQTLLNKTGVVSELSELTLDAMHATNEKVEAVSNRVGVVETDLGAVTNRVQATEQSIQQQSIRIDNTEARIGAVETDVQQVTARVDDGEAVIQNHEARITAGESEVTTINIAVNGSALIIMG